jgi:hypothetical protein
MKTRAPISCETMGESIPSIKRMFGCRMRARHIFPLLFLLAHVSSQANIEWPLLYSMRAVAFTENLVRECNTSFPNDAVKRQEAFVAWKSKNQETATKTRAFNIERLRKEIPQVDIPGFDRELDDIQMSAISQARGARDNWKMMCADMARWLSTEESNVERQLPDFMQAPR